MSKSFAMSFSTRSQYPLRMASTSFSFSQYYTSPHAATRTETASCIFSSSNDARSYSIRKEYADGASSTSFYTSQSSNRQTRSARTS